MRVKVKNSQLDWWTVGLWGVGVIVMLPIALNRYEFWKNNEFAYTFLAAAAIYGGLFGAFYAFIDPLIFKKFTLRQPVMLVLSVVLFFLGLPNYSKEARQTDFEKHLDARMSTIELARTELERSEFSRVTFECPEPGAAAPVDRDQGRMWAFESEDGLWVWWPILRWWIDNHQGFVWSESGDPPPARSFLDVTHIERLDDHWFWIHTT